MPPPRDDITKDKRYRALDPKVKKAVNGHLAGRSEGVKRDVGLLAKSATFSHLTAAEQERLLGFVSSHEGVRNSYRRMIGADAYQALPSERRADSMRTFMKRQDVFSARIDGLKRDLDHQARKQIDALVRDGGFGRLSDREQDRFVDYLGGDNNIARGGRSALEAMTASAGYEQASPTERAKWLRDYWTDQPGAGGTPSRRGEPERAPYTLRENKPGQYSVTIGGQSIPVRAPTHVDDKKRLLGPDDKPVQIAGRDAYVHSPEQVAKALAAMPPELRRLVNSVTVSPTRNASDSYWTKRYNRDARSGGDPTEATTYKDWAARYRHSRRGPPAPFRSYATAGKAGDITFYPTARATAQGYLDKTMIHEAGHTYSARNFPGFEAWDRARKADGIVPSNYARNAATEDFSETLELYHTVRGTTLEPQMRKMMPDRFRLIDAMFPAWVER